MKTAKDKILSSASTLFYSQGIAQTGINAITAHADVAKMSLYNNFSNKAEIVAAYIQARHQEWLGLYAMREQQENTPIEKILAVFDSYCDHAEFAYENGFRGCGLLNAAAEFAANTPERNAVRLHKDEVEHILVQHLKDCVKDQTQVSNLALQIPFLLEGSIARAGLEGTSQKIIQAKAITHTLLKQVC